MLPVEKKADCRRKRKKREVRREERVRLRWGGGVVGLLCVVLGVDVDVVLDAVCCVLVPFDRGVAVCCCDA